MNKRFKQIPMSELRVKLPKLRRQVQSGGLRIVCTHYGEVAAFLLPLQDVEGFNSEGEEPVIQATEEMPLTEFRDQLTEAWERLLGGTDCIYLTFHKRRVVAFVSTRFTHHLSLPLIGDVDKVLFISSETRV
ncbi:type II toxin-antitoxin system Phd/YefM family antitoxin [Adonisia turfae]|uniref:Type II toxin-antitoxin system Phd/YefM family antitoxin n=1 Tax=Adonisia turfae CCMR0081 TaxID=2292702 RepID=A0A6M0RZ07_9CYAN|nr:type II toxin-antitoxin system Phd/YefM family antitoxin [Adonisia turfae]NEZ61170.1 type II toxin-antitoxin system Phd/YefM family antitoxin [Adonisia turfae CCMR0081]